MESRSLEQILLTMELITREQLTEALEYQCRLPQSEYLPLQDILVYMEFVSWEAIESIESYLASPTPTENVADRIRQSVQQGTGADAKPETDSGPEVEPEPSTAEPEVPSPPVLPAANEEWQQMHAMEEWQQMQSLCVEESQGDSQNLDKIMEDLGISDPRALQVGFTIKRKP